MCRVGLRSCRANQVNPPCRCGAITCVRMGLTWGWCHPASRCANVLHTGGKPGQQQQIQLLADLMGLGKNTVNDYSARRVDGIEQAQLETETRTEKRPPANLKEFNYIYLYLDRYRYVAIAFLRPENKIPGEATCKREKEKCVGKGGRQRGTG